jgi:hypothetical protein
MDVEYPLFTFLKAIFFVHDPPIDFFLLQERCAAAETVLLVGRVLNSSKAHLHSVLPKNNTSVVEEFFRTLVSFF